MLFTQLAAIIAMQFSKNLLHQKKSHNTDGIVKVMCCHAVIGKVLFVFSIQISVAFLPQDEQALVLHVWVIFFVKVHSGLEQLYWWYPLVFSLQLNSLLMVEKTEDLILCLCLMAKLTQLLLDKRIPLIV